MTTAKPKTWTPWAVVALSLALAGAAAIPLGSAETPDLVRFLGRFHPLVLHLPIGALTVLLIVEVLAVVRRSAPLRAAAGVLTSVNAVTAVLAASLGLLLAHSGEYGTGLITRHLWLGTATAILALWLVLFRRRADHLAEPAWIPSYHGTLGLTVAVMGLAGHYGGSLTHGSDYLTAYMPAPLRSLVGAAGAQTLASVAPAELPVYEAVVHPILKEKCISCHGSDKQEHQLRLDSYAATMQGGKTGSNIVPGQASSSLLLQTVHLPLNDKRHMPPEGKSQMTPDDIALVSWWIERGALEKDAVGALKRPRTVARILQQRIGLADAAGPELAMSPLAEVLPKAAEVSLSIGIELIPIAANTDGLQLSVLPGGKDLDDAALAQLLPLKANITRLQLGGASITDAGLEHLAQMTNLEHLDLSRTAITDAGITKLASLQKLQHLNVYGTKITDAGLEPLKDLASLKKVYLWQTAVSTQALASLRKAFVDEGQKQAWEKEIASIQARIAGMGVSVNAGISDPTNAAPATASMPSATAAAAKPVNEKCSYTGKPVNPAQTSTYKGQLVAFCCDKCKATFDKNPDAEAAKIPELAKK